VIGLVITSLRLPVDNLQSGWWDAFVHPLFTIRNYLPIFEGDQSFLQSIVVSFVIAVPVTVLTTLLSAVGAYALTRMKFAGRVVLSVVMAGMIVIPPQVTLVPLLELFSKVGLVGTIPAIWIYQVGFTLPYGIFLIRGAVSEVPNDLFESAAIDGARPFRAFRSILLPVISPTLAALAIMQFLWSWNDLLIPLVFLGGGDGLRPVTVEVSSMISATTGTGVSQMLAAAVLSVVPPLAILFGLQKYFVRGVLGGAVKG
jgi:alpha-glucoside transport system permease protein